MKRFPSLQLHKLFRFISAASIFFFINSATGQEVVRKIVINQAPTFSNIGSKTEVRKAEKLAIPPFSLRNLDSNSLAILTPLTPRPIEEKTLFKDFERFKDTSKLIYDTSEGFGPKKAEFVRTYIKSSFDANIGDYRAPLDNTIAVSDNGNIISVSNDIIEYYSRNSQKIIARRNLTGFFGNKIGDPCDPKAYFDPFKKRFIVFAQSCDGQYNNSNVVIGFSHSNNPSDGWNFYKIKVSGAPFATNQWFDYPKLGISTDGVFISGNIFQNYGGENNEFIQSVVYQVDKDAGFEGKEVNYRLWYNINDGHPGEGPAVLLPINYAFNGIYGPGIFLIGTSRGNNTDNVKLFDITGSISDDNTIMNYYKIKTTPYNYFAKAVQMDYPIDNGDTRIQDGFYTGEKIAFAFTSGNERRFSRINLNLLNLATLTNKSKLLGDNLNSSYAYPSVMPISEKGEQLNIVLQYNSASNNSYPDIRYKVCDDTLNCSGEILIRKGDNIIGFYDRWGDYSAITKDHAAKNNVWMTSCYANRAGIRQTCITNLAPLGEITNIDIFKTGSSQNVNFKVAGKTSIEAFLKKDGKTLKKVFEGFAWPGKRALNVITEEMEAGKYILEVRDKLSNQIIKKQFFIIE